MPSEKVAKILRKRGVADAEIAAMSELQAWDQPVASAAVDWPRAGRTKSARFPCYRRRRRPARFERISSRSAAQTTIAQCGEKRGPGVL